MKIYNNNPAFGDCGPFESEAETFESACEKLADEIRPSFELWARERLDVLEQDSGETVGDVEQWISDDISEMRDKFIAGLAEVRHCDECGKDYHEDAPELGHADGCSSMSEATVCSRCGATCVLTTLPQHDGTTTQEEVCPNCLY
ncbi:MAG: hypothetical protein PHX83_06550 [Acidobacteriia bacterium]|nr:hypothetical protein [Terriglobia bacterium]